MALDPLICDIYADDCGGKPNIAALIAAGYPWCGLILKATEGTSYPTQPSSRAWFMRYWPLVRSFAADRYGVDFFRGCYMYWREDADPATQADFFLELVRDAGGWGSGDLWPMIDVERADNPRNLTKAQVEDSVSAVAERIYTELGRTPMLYGASLMADLEITSHMGCSTLLFPRVTSILPPETYEQIGWELAKPATIPTLWAWQLCEDGVSYVKGYPKTTPLGNVDYSAILAAGGGQAALTWTRQNI